MELRVPYTRRVQNQQTNLHTTAHLNTERPLWPTSGTGQYPSLNAGQIITCHFFGSAWSFKWFCISLEAKRSLLPFFVFSHTSARSSTVIARTKASEAVSPLQARFRVHSPIAFPYFHPVYLCFLTGTKCIMRSILCKLAIVSRIFWILVANFNRIVNFTLLAKRTA